MKIIITEDQKNTIVINYRPR